jgi:hypothetical protein
MKIFALLEDGFGVAGRSVEAGPERSVEERIIRSKVYGQGIRCHRVADGKAYEQGSRSTNLGYIFHEIVDRADDNLAFLLGDSRQQATLHGSAPLLLAFISPFHISFTAPRSGWEICTVFIFRVWFLVCLSSHCLRYTKNVFLSLHVYTGIHEK